MTFQLLNELLFDIQRWAVFLLLFLFLLELGAKVVLNRRHQLGIVESHDTYDKISSDQRAVSLSVASLVFAGLAIVLSNEPSKLYESIIAFSMAFGLLLIAAFVHEFTLTRRVFLTFQEMSLEYGLLMMVLGLFLLIAELVPRATSAMLVVFLIVFGFRFASVWGELEAHYNEAQPNHD